MHASVEEANVPDSSEDVEGVFADDIGFDAGLGGEEEEAEEAERQLPLETRRAECMELYDDVPRRTREMAACGSCAGGGANRRSALRRIALSTGRGVLCTGLPQVP